MVWLAFGMRNGPSILSLDAVARRGHEVTSVEVIKLADREVKPGEAFYHVRHERADFPIVGRVTLSLGAQATTLVKLWRQVRFSNGWSTLCHEPGFVLRFIVGSRCAFEVSVCFKCENICWEPTWFTSSIPFDGASQTGTPASKMDELKNYLMKL